MPPRKPRDDETGDEPRVLVRNVVVEGKVYGPANPENVVTPEIAAQITNPAAWGED